MRLVDSARSMVDQRSPSTASVVVQAEASAVELDAATALPNYLVDTYSWAYLRPRAFCS